MAQKPSRPRPAETAPDFRKARLCACGEHGFVGLTKGLVAFVDPDDIPRIAHWLWCVSTPARTETERGRRGPHAVRAHKGSMLKMHKALCPSPGMVDHIDGDTLNNRRSTNLRPASPSQNAANGHAVTGAIPFKGVTAHPRDPGRFMARVQGKVIGWFDCALEAARAYDREATAIWGDYAQTNAMLGLLKEAAE